MNASLLAQQMKTKILTSNPQFADLGDQLDYLLAAISEAVVEHVRASAEVTVTVTSVSGVTTGPGVSGPGTGTATIT